MNDQNETPSVSSHPFTTRVFDDLNRMKDECHALAIQKGWYDEVESKSAYISRCVANFHGEVSEFWEAHRDGKLNDPCDKAEKMVAAGIDPLTCIEEELADIIIRVLDTAGKLNVDISKAVLLKHSYNRTRAYRHGGKKA